LKNKRKKIEGKKEKINCKVSFVKKQKYDVESGRGRGSGK